jgi:hypothetical protein
MKDLTLRVPDELVSQLVEFGRREHRGPEEVAIALLAGGLRAESFRRLRCEALERLGPDALSTDQQAFDEIA